MFKVQSRKTLDLLARRSLRQNKTRNLIAVIAIMLTSILFTGVFTIGMSIVDSLETATMRQVGTCAHAGFKFLTQEQYDQVKADPKVKDISYNILIGTGENPEFKKTYVEIRYTEEKAALWSFNLPTTGTLPKEKMDLATTTAVLDALGLPHELGVQVPLDFTANNITYHETFTLCGFWETDVVMGANQAFISRQYADEVAPVWHESRLINNNSEMAGSINPSLWFATSWDIDGQMQALKDRLGFGPEVNEGVNWAYSSAEVDATSIILLVSVLLLITFSGYLIIYNIFYISVSKDIRFYGLLKTIGTTDRQLKKIVRKQAWVLSLIGLPLGLLGGYLLSFYLVPLVFSISNLSDAFLISRDPWIFIAGGAFTLLTVWISCIKPCRLVGKISPIEAVRYNESTPKRQTKAKKSQKLTAMSLAWANLKRTPKKAASIVLSLSLSMVLLLSTVTLVQGFDMEKYLQNQIMSDFYITDASIINVFSPGNSFDSITPEDQAAVQALDGLTACGNVYMREAQHHLSPEAFANAQEIIQADYAQDWLASPYVQESLRLLNEEQILAAHIYGIDELLADKTEIFAGSFDGEKFASGDYVIVTSFNDLGQGRYYDIGDKVTIDFGDGRSKEYEVLAIGDIPYALGPQHGHMLDIYFTLPSDEYIRMTGENNAMKIAFNVEPAQYAAVESWVENYCENINNALDFKSRSTYIAEFENMQRTFLLVGGLLSLILALIGLLNFTNSMITSVESRKHEFAVLQSIGMSGRQLRRMLICEGLLYALIAIVLTLTVGNVLGYGLVIAVANQMWYFTYRLHALPIILFVLFIPLSFILTAIISAICYQNMRKHSIVERLRIDE